MAGFFDSEDFAQDFIDPTPGGSTSSMKHPMNAAAPAQALEMYTSGTTHIGLALYDKNRNPFASLTLDKAEAQILADELLKWVNE